MAVAAHELGGQVLRLRGAPSVARRQQAPPGGQRLRQPHAPLVHQVDTLGEPVQGGAQVAHVLVVAGGGEVGQEARTGHQETSVVGRADAPTTAR